MDGIKYALSSDGTSIGYLRYGDGPPFVRTPALMGALRLIDTVDRRSMNPAMVSTGRSVVRYDRRGTGYSDRDVRDFSMEAAIADLGAVVDAVSTEPVAIGATWDHGPVAMRYAAENPDRVSHLVLETTFARGKDLLETTSTKFVDRVLTDDWDYFLKVIARVEVNLDRPQSDRWEEIAREEMSHEVMRAWWDSIFDYDATDWLGSISTPTLIVQRSRNSVDRQALAPLRELAAKVPNATLVRGDGAERHEAITKFLGSSVPVGTLGAFRTVMFTDLVSSTSMTQRVGDVVAQQTLEVHDAAVRDALEHHNGVEIKHTGDGIMASFLSAADAARAAETIMTALDVADVQARIGLNAGEPLQREGDLFGTVVQLAARLCDAAGTGETLATQFIRDLTAGKDIRWNEGQILELKGFEQPIHVYALAGTSG
jgi:class 3 adenylate cyclase